MSWKLAELRWRQIIGLKEVLYSVENDPDGNWPTSDTTKRDDVGDDISQSHSHSAQCNVSATSGIQVMKNEKGQTCILQPPTSVLSAPVRINGGTYDTSFSSTTPLLTYPVDYHALWKEDSNLLGDMYMVGGPAAPGNSQPHRIMHPHISSAYNELQQRREPSPGLDSSAPKSGRFPLESSHDDDNSSMESEPGLESMTNLNQQRVASARVILREGDPVQESSAILESADEPDRAIPSGAARSSTLDRIVAEYAESCQDCLEARRGRDGSGKPLFYCHNHARWAQRSCGTESAAFRGSVAFAQDLVTSTSGPHKRQSNALASSSLIPSTAMNDTKGNSDNYPIISITNEPIANLPLTSLSPANLVEATLARRLIQGNYTDSDAEISLFLRNNRIPIDTNWEHPDDRSGSRSVVRNPEGGHTEHNPDAIERSNSASFLEDDAVRNLTMTRLEHHAMQTHNRDPEAQNSNTFSEKTSPRVTRLRRQMRGEIPNDYINFSFPRRATHGSSTPTSDRASASLLESRMKSSMSTTDKLIDIEKCPAFPLTPELLSVASLPGLSRTPYERIEYLGNGRWLEKAWCFKHNRMEFSYADMILLEKGIAEARTGVQHDAGRVVILISAMLYPIGGCIVLRSIAQKGSYARLALVEASKRIGHGQIVVSEVHPVDAKVAVVVEWLSFLIWVVGVLPILIWAAITYDH